MTAGILTQTYFIRACGHEQYQQVDKATYVMHERNAGFEPKHGQPKNEPCTSAFSDSLSKYEGKITYGALTPS